MEKVTVSFKNEKNTIKVNFEYNSETGDLDYQLDLGNYTKDTPMDLSVFLATMFLNNLDVQDTD